MKNKRPRGVVPTEAYVRAKVERVLTDRDPGGAGRFRHLIDPEEIGFLRVMMREDKLSKNKIRMICKIIDRVYL